MSGVSALDAGTTRWRQTPCESAIARCFFVAGRRVLSGACISALSETHHWCSWCGAYELGSGKNDDVARNHMGSGSQNDNNNNLCWSVAGQGWGCLTLGLLMSIPGDKLTLSEQLCAFVVFDKWHMTTCPLQVFMSQG